MRERIEDLGVLEVLLTQIIEDDFFDRVFEANLDDPEFFLNRQELKELYEEAKIMYEQINQCWCVASGICYSEPITAPTRQESTLFEYNDEQIRSFLQSRGNEKRLKEDLDNESNAI